MGRDLSVTIIPCGAMTADITWLLLAPGRAMRTRQNKTAPAEWTDVPSHCVLVDTPDGRLLWDTSCPRDWEQRWAPTGLQDFFPYDHVSEEEYLDSRLKQLGLAPADLDFVAFSHLHFDHAGNALLFKDSGARLVCSEAEKEFAFGFDGPFTGAHIKDDYASLDFETVSGDAEFLPGVSFIQTPGHTPGSMSMRIDLPESGTMIFTADAVYMGAELRAARRARGHRQQPGAVLRLGGEAAGDRHRDRRDAGLRARPGPDQAAADRPGRELPLMTESQIEAHADDLTEETIFTWGAPPLKFGAGAVDEIGFEMAQFGAKRVLILTDPGISALGLPGRIADSLTRYGITSEVFDGVHVEPTDDSMDKAAGYARSQGPWDGFIAVGGGSSIDTAKAVNLLTTDGGELMDYINAPIGAGRAPQHQLKPLIAVPTTAGTGSESTAMCVLDILSMKVKSGISHWRLRPTLAIIDPLVSLSLPPEVTAAAGMDIVCHAVESYTARWYTSFDRKTPEQRVTYCGSNPISDLWSERSLALIARSFRTAVHDGSDLAARSDMMMAATFAGMGFGNSGVHIPHANAYPIAGMVRDFRPAGYPQQEPMVPHGMSVSLTAPEAFRFSFSSAPERHLRAAAMLAPDQDKLNDAGEQLPSAMVELMRDIGIPNGIGAVGYTESDVPDLVPGTMKQQRLLATCPRPVDADDIAGILTRSIENW